jgi:hypothetical protein
MPFGSHLLPVLLSWLPLAVYRDATGHGIGRITGDPTSLPAGVWGILSAIPVLNILSLVAYVILRQDLIEMARVHPVRVATARRALSYVLLLMASSLMSPVYLLP